MDANTRRPQDEVPTWARNEAVFDNAFLIDPVEDITRPNGSTDSERVPRQFDNALVTSNTKITSGRK